MRNVQVCTSIYNHDINTCTNHIKLLTYRQVLYSQMHQNTSQDTSLTREQDMSGVAVQQKFYGVAFVIDGGGFAGSVDQAALTIIHLCGATFDMPPPQSLACARPFPALKRSSFHTFTAALHSYGQQWNTIKHRCTLWSMLSKAYNACLRLQFSHCSLAQLIICQRAYLAPYSPLPLPHKPPRYLATVFITLI